MAETTDSTWSAVLDEMEADLTGNPDPGQSGAWSAPAGAGPLPPHLFDRAKRVLDAQQRAIALLTEEQASVGRHLAALKTVPSASAATPSIYLDVVS